jgi:hypothetical protein
MESKKASVQRPGYYNPHLLLTGAIVAVIGIMCCVLSIWFYIYMK